MLPVTTESMGGPGIMPLEYIPNYYLGLCEIRKIINERWGWEPFPFRYPIMQIAHSPMCHIMHIQSFATKHLEPPCA